MCGIVGLAGPLACREGRHLEAMRDTMIHRGPDAAGRWATDDERVQFGHRRLSIVDLSEAGHQPMVDGETGVALVLNGEIYDWPEHLETLRRAGHTFRGHSDTEVLLRGYLEWGEGVLDRIDGMYAFAIWDGRTRTLLLARDRAGEKPLYYWEGESGLAFASEMKALLACPAVPRVVDHAGLDRFLAYGNVVGDRTILRGVRKLLPGHTLRYRVDEGRSELRRYWSIPEPSEAPDARTDAEWVDALDAQLLESVRNRLLNADVPVGILLSGGTDSSLVASAAARISDRPIRAFTVSFQPDSGLDESGYARIVAESLGAEHTVLPAGDPSSDLFLRLAAQFDEPHADSSMIPTYLVTSAIRRETKVALGGDGGDELFGGYGWHSLVETQARIRRRIPRPLRPCLRRAVERLPLGMRGRNTLWGAFAEEPEAISRFNTLFPPEERRRLVTAGVPAESAGEWVRSLVPERGSSLHRATAAQFASYLVDDVLVKVDRASMLTSLEVRAPLLSRGMIEFAFAQVPDRLKVRGSEKKILPRMLADRILPAELDTARKQGFSAPIGRWLDGPWKSIVDDALANPTLGVFSPDRVRRLRTAEGGTGVHAHRVFALVMFELWCREVRPTDLR